MANKTQDADLSWLDEYMAKHPDRAREHLRTAMKINPDSVLAWREIRILLWRMAGEVADAGFTGKDQSALYDQLREHFNQIEFIGNSNVSHR